ncbi:MAG: amidohydrolase family protein [Gracilibacteraceae bacterium]|jgi:imidazolonepropionase-like amidohydrolase|nr:amidohydrolase family protein [Gracilibacteraceae bacterium]
MKTLVKTKYLLDCTGSDPIPGGWFTFADGVILSVGRPGEPAPPAAGADEVLDFADDFVMPGLIDAHIHLGLSHIDDIEPMTVNEQMAQPPQVKICKAAMYLRQHLRAGVTTVRGMGEEHYIDIFLARAVAEGYVEGPRIIPAGNGIKASHGQGQVGLSAADGPEEVRRACRENLARGAELLKIFVSGGVVSGKGGLQATTYTPAEIRVAVEEAAALDKYVAAHVHGGPGLDMCIDVGVRSLEHASVATDAQIEKILKAGLWVTGTFSPAFHPRGVRFLSAEQKERLVAVKEIFMETFSKFVALGANLSFGTDGVHGALAFEAQTIAKCGADNMRAILYITRDAAKACRREDEIGVIAPGKYADFITLAGNPLEKLENLTAVRSVCIGGAVKIRPEQNEGRGKA